MSDAHASLHIYGQDGPHDPVIIVGNRLGLLQLLNAVLDALAGEARRPRVFFVTDGEGYEVDVSLTTNEGLDAYVSPYKADWAHDPAEDASPRWPLKAKEEP